MSLKVSWISYYQNQLLALTTLLNPNLHSLQFTQRTATQRAQHTNDMSPISQLESRSRGPQSPCSPSDQVASPVTCVREPFPHQNPNIDMLAASLCNTASYVDIIAKTDTYVGFLPSHALERLLEKRPIVLLTLAKRLISLLSPLGTFRSKNTSRKYLTSLS